MRTVQPRRETLLIVALVLPAFCFSLQTTAVLPTLPAMQSDLHTTTGWATWIITVFMLVAAVSAPLTGKLADEYGGRRLLLITLIFMLVGAVGAACASNIWVVIAFRAIQGVGGACLPLSLLLISEHVRRERTGRALGSMVLMITLGSAVALVVGTALTDLLSWRAMFGFVALAVAIAVLLAYRVVPDSATRPSGRPDLPGAATLALAIGALLLGLTEGNDWGWASGATIALFGVSLAAGAVWVVVELLTQEPMVDLRMLTRRTVMLANLAAAALGFVSYAVLSLVPRLVSAPRGLDPSVTEQVTYGFNANSTLAGLYILPSVVTGLVCAATVSLIGRRYGWKWPLVLAMAIWVLCATALAQRHDESWQILLIMLLFGYGLSLAPSTAGKLIVDDVRPDQRGVAAALNFVMIQIGGVMGAQVAAAILSTDTIGDTAVPAESAYVTAFYLAALVALVATTAALLTTSRRRPKANMAEMTEASPQTGSTSEPSQRRVAAAQSRHSKDARDAG